MLNDERCGRCPIAPEAGVACPAITRRHREFCRLLDPSHPAHSPGYAVELLRLAGLAEPWSPARQAPAAEAVATLTVEPEAVEPPDITKPPPGSHWGRLQLVASCDYLGPVPIREAPENEPLIVDPTRDVMRDVNDFLAEGRNGKRRDDMHDAGIASCPCTPRRLCLLTRREVTAADCLKCVVAGSDDPRSSASG